MYVDREAFLALVFTMGACGGQQSSTPVVIAAVDPPAPDAAAPIVTAEPVATTPVPTDARNACQKENDEGEVDCSWVDKKKMNGPSCEGVEGVCDLLKKNVGFRNKPASVAAKCLSRLGKNACNIMARKKCYAEGLAASCPEPEFEQFCEQTLESCKARHQKPSFTKEGCMKALSGQKAGADRDWAQSAMGPSTEGKCELMFTVY